MRDINYEDLQAFVKEAKKLVKMGEVADYIPALKSAVKSDLSISIFNGNSYVAAGDVEKRFTLQSISKVITLALALMDRGERYVFTKVGMEPTGDPFNSIAKLETSVPSKPLNPMINAGALAVTSMIKGKSSLEKLARILHIIHEMTNNLAITYSEEVAGSEFSTSYLNRSLCYFLKQHKIIHDDVEDLMDIYTKHCAIEMNCIDLAKLASVFAFNGVSLQTGKQVIPQHVAQICKTFMVTCGMYNASGEFAIKIGIPAKSGVSGGILGVVPGRFGIGIYGPSLDEKGNSIAGIKLLELLSSTYHLSMF